MGSGAVAGHIRVMSATRGDDHSICHKDIQTVTTNSYLAQNARPQISLTFE